MARSTTSVQRLFAVCLTLALLTGCSTVQIVREVPSPELLRDCPVPIANLRTNGELAKTYQLTRDALERCNIDKAYLREWAKEQ